jgi:2-dehydro-3-deoxygluconokinase
MIKSIVTFGEIMMRLAPPDHLRLRQARSLDITYGGAEANVAIALANFGLPVQFITVLPDNELGISCLQSLKQHGVGCDHIILGGSRLGLYFLEVGAGNRPSQIIYDRKHSSFYTINDGKFDWDEIFTGAGWFHWSGISPALSEATARTTARAIDKARAAGLMVSCDLNYRHSLWKWGRSPTEVMPDLVGRCDVLAGNAAHLMLGLPDLPPGSNPDEAVEVCTQLTSFFPNLKQVTMTCRQSVSAVEQHFTAVLWHSGQSYVSQTFALAESVDRVGAGDAFMAGLIFGLITDSNDPQQVINIAAASAVLKHTIKGDANLVSIKDVARLLDSQSGIDIIR